MRPTRRAFLLGLLVLILAASGGVILWPQPSTVLAVASEDPVTIRPPDLMPVHVAPTAAPTAAPTTIAPTTIAPTTTTTARRPPVTHVARPPATPRVASAPSGGVSAFLVCVRWHESGNQYHAGSAGAYGILVSTWQNRTLGYSARYGTSTAGAASEAAQDAAARDLFARYGSKPWSTRRLCGG